MSSSVVEIREALATSVAVSDDTLAVDSGRRTYHRRTAGLVSAAGERLGGGAEFLEFDRRRPRDSLAGSQ